MERQKRRFIQGGITIFVVVIFVSILLKAIPDSSNRENAPTNPAKTDLISDNILRQIELLGKPTITPFEPDEEFTVVRNIQDNALDGRIMFVAIPLRTIAVKRMSDGAIFQVAYNFVETIIPGKKVKIFLISWKPNLSVNVTPAKFPLAVYTEDADRYYRSLAKNSK